MSYRLAKQRRRMMTTWHNFTTGPKFWPNRDSAGPLTFKIVDRKGIVRK